MKAIIFDVDGVIIVSAKQKERVIIGVLQKHNLYDIEWVSAILAMSLNRKVLVERIYELHSFDKKLVLDDINNELLQLEKNPIPIISVVTFIKKNYRNYLFFTNTSLPRASLERVFDSLSISHCFKKLYTGDDGFKKDNIISIMDEYWLTPNEVLFIDDTLSHIENVSETGVNALHFSDARISIEDYI